MLDAELAAEQAHVDRAYDRLAELQALAREVATSERAEHGKTPAAMLERDVREAHGTRRYGSLRIDGGLCFGRIDRSDGQTFHIGRIGVADEDQTPLVVDWRAPVAEPFYRATPLDPLGLVRRRHLLTRGRRVVGIEDEPLDLDGGDRRRGLVLVGEAALVSALTERRTGRMRDIVATIQREQDEIIRSPLSGVLVVQGGPGTGKTAVALHRAAYLLYRHRFPLEEQGVLVLGPNPLFLRYIERVLPSLGESRCRLATIDDLHGRRATAAEPDPLVARLKGDGRMATVVDRAVRSRQRPLARKHVVAVDSYRLPIGRNATTRIVEAAQARRGTHNARRPLVARLVLRHLARQYDLAVERARRAGLGAERRPREEVEERLRASPEFRRLLDRIWPALTAERLLADLFAHDALLREAAAGVLDDGERSMLARDRDRPWSTADLPLLDEADVLLGPAPARTSPTVAPLEDASAMVDRVLAEQLPFCPECDQELTYAPATQRWECGTFGCGGSYRSEEVLSPAAALLVRDLQRVLTDMAAGDREVEPEGPFATYGHVVVDEAQELSAMQWRVIARRCPSRSMTIVGDLAQGSAPGAASSWDDVLAALQAERGRVRELTVNYRTPEEVMRLADRIRPGASARCVRRAGQEPVLTPVEDPAEVVAIVEREVRAVRGGKVGVVAPPELAAVLRRSFAQDGLDALDEAVAILEPEAAKGLEFDSVVVVEPGAFDAASLYVALTRTTTRLVVAHMGPLPAAFATSGSTR